MGADPASGGELADPETGVHRSGGVVVDHRPPAKPVGSTVVPLWGPEIRFRGIPDHVTGVGIHDLSHIVVVRKEDTPRTVPPATVVLHTRLAGLSIALQEPGVQSRIHI